MTLTIHIPGVSKWPTLIILDPSPGSLFTIPPPQEKKVTPSLVVGSSTLHRRSLYILARYYSKWLQSNWKNANLAIGASTSCTTTLSHAWDARVFLTWLEQGLHAKANAEERPVLFQVLPGSHRGKPRPFEFFSQPNGSEEIQRYKSAAYKLTDCLHPWKAGIIAIVPQLIPWTAYSFLVSIHQLLCEVRRNEHQIIDWRSSKTSLKTHLMLTSRLLLLRFKFKQRKCCGCITPNLPICQSGPLKINFKHFWHLKGSMKPFRWRASTQAPKAPTPGKISRLARRMSSGPCTKCTCTSISEKDAEVGGQTWYLDIRYKIYSIYLLDIYTINVCLYYASMRTKTGKSPEWDEI